MKMRMMILLTLLSLCLPSLSEAACGRLFGHGRIFGRRAGACANGACAPVQSAGHQQHDPLKPPPAPAK